MGDVTLRLFVSRREVQRPEGVSCLTKGEWREERERGEVRVCVGNLSLIVDQNKNTLVTRGGVRKPIQLKLTQPKGNQQPQTAT